MRIGNCVAINARGVHLFEPVQLTLRLLNGKNRVLYLLLRLDFQPILIFVVEIISRQSPREAFDA